MSKWEERGELVPLKGVFETCITLIPLVGMADDLWTSKSGTSGALNLEWSGESRAMRFGVCLFRGVFRCSGYAGLLCQRSGNNARGH